MPTKQGGRSLKNASTSDRCSFRRNTALPAASTPCSWKTRLAMSKPTVVISMVDGSFSSLHSTARAWHSDAVRGRPPHQIYTTRTRGLVRDGGRFILLEPAGWCETAVSLAVLDVFELLDKTDGGVPEQSLERVGQAMRPGQAHPLE